MVSFASIEGGSIGGGADGVPSGPEVKYPATPPTPPVK